MTPKRLATLLFLLCLLAVPLRAEELPLSPNATASILTCGDGNEFYQAFGHTALRIFDPDQHINLVYNYGTFDFNTPHFYWQFVRGRLDYRLDVEPYEIFLLEYKYEGRAVWEQRLNLTHQEVCNLFLMLEQNYSLPDLRFYKYDFFLDNCATRVHDIVLAASGHNPIELAAPWPRKGMSFRKYVHLATEESSPWTVLGIDLLLGLTCDHPCNATEATFYPIALMHEYNAAVRDDQPAVHKNIKLLSDVRPATSHPFPPIVAMVLLFVAVAIFTHLEKKGHISYGWSCTVDRLLFILAGAIGIVLCFMWFGTDHSCTAWNLNLLWANPLLLLIAIRLKQSPRWSLWLQLACLAVATAYVLCCGLSLALLPVILAIALRVACLLWPRHYQSKDNLSIA